MPPCCVVESTPSRTRHGFGRRPASAVSASGFVALESEPNPMSINRLLASVAFGACLVVLVDAGPSTAATPPSSVSSLSVPIPGLPGSAALGARSGAQWLAAQFGPDGAIPSATTPGSDDLSATANGVLALASAGTDTSVAERGLSFLAGHVDAYVQTGGVDQPGSLALLVLDAHALGLDPTTFGGTDLVTRLEQTQHSTGADAGLFGLADPSYDGAYRQGLALAALAAGGVTTGAPLVAAEQWLTGQQCPGGGWTSYVAAANPCNGLPTNYVGPDTNSTAAAVLGLAAQGAASAARSAALGFLRTDQNGDGGWGYYPTNTTDPNSTGLVIQAFAAQGTRASDLSLVQPQGSPVSVLLSFQVGIGAEAGAFSFPGVPGPNLLATNQAVPGLADVVLPFRAASVTAAAGADLSAPVSATVSLVGAPPGPTAGTVTFSAGTTELCSATVVAGRATCSSPNVTGVAPSLAVFTPVDASIGLATASPTAGAYLSVAADGGVFGFGSAGFAGSLGGSHLNAPIVGVAAAPSGNGYWLVAADGGVFGFGSAGFAGSLGGSHLNAPIVGVAAAPSGNGYWLVAADGGVFGFGSAGFAGSLGGSHLNAPIVGVAAAPSGSVGMA
jgi:hypothetical protein